VFIIKHNANLIFQLTIALKVRRRERLAQKALGGKASLLQKQKYMQIE
jgi:hypothetical protein